MEVKIMVEVITLKQATYSLWPVIVFLLGTATLNPYLYGALDEKVFSLSLPVSPFSTHCGKSERNLVTRV